MARSPKTPNSATTASPPRSTAPATTSRCYVAYVVAAGVSGKSCAAAYVEDMYNPSRYGRTGTGSSRCVRRNERIHRHSVSRAPLATSQLVAAASAAAGFDRSEPFCDMGGLAGVGPAAQAREVSTTIVTATASCSAPMPWQTAAGGCRSMPEPASIPLLETAAGL